MVGGERTLGQGAPERRRTRRAASWGRQFACTTDTQPHIGTNAAELSTIDQVVEVRHVVVALEAGEHRLVANHRGSLRAARRGIGQERTAATHVVEVSVRVHQVGDRRR